MDWGSILYLGITFGLFAIFAVIVFRTYRRKNKTRMEEAKHRMLDED
jgi:cbb3-type cytochrome oxidase subunit 3